MKDESKYRIVVSGPGFGLDQLVEKDKVSRVVAIILSHSTDSQGFSDAADTEAKTISIREYLSKIGPKANDQKIATIVSYLEKYQQSQNVSVKEIKEQFEKAKEALPSNFSRDLGNAISSGYIAESSTKGKYYLTGTGETFIETGFKGASSGGIDRPKQKRKGNRKGKIKAAPIREEVLNMDIDPAAEGYPSYWGDLKTKADRALWLILQAKEKGVENVNSRELSILASKINDKILSNQAVSLLNNHKKRDRIQISSSGEHLSFKILQPGIDYIKTEVKQRLGEVAESD